MTGKPLPTPEEVDQAMKYLEILGYQYTAKLYRKTTGESYIGKNLKTLIAEMKPYLEKGAIYRPKSLEDMTIEELTTELKKQQKKDNKMWAKRAETMKAKTNLLRAIVFQHPALKSAGVSSRDYGISYECGMLSFWPTDYFSMKIVCSGQRYSESYSFRAAQTDWGTESIDYNRIGNFFKVASVVLELIQSVKSRGRRFKSEFQQLLIADSHSIGDYEREIRNELANRK